MENRENVYRSRHGMESRNEILLLSMIFWLKSIK